MAESAIHHRKPINEAADSMLRKVATACDPLLEDPIEASTHVSNSRDTSNQVSPSHSIAHNRDAQSGLIAADTTP